MCRCDPCVAFHQACCAKPLPGEQIPVVMSASEAQRLRELVRQAHTINTAK